MKNWGIILLLALLATPYCRADENNNDSIYISYYLNNRENYYIYSDVANVRKAANIDSDIIAKLRCGDEVTLLDYDYYNEKNIYTQNRLRGKWLKIKYSNNNTEQEGYIWEGNISPKQLRRNDVKFIFGIEEYTGDRENIKWQLKALQNKQVVSQTNFTNPYIGFYTAGIIDNAGIESIEKVIKLGFSGESCGVPTIDYYFAWNDNTLFYIDNTYSVGDADAYSYSESIVFPKGYDCGYCTTIIKLISQYINPEYEDDKTKKTDEPDVKYKTEIYVWDGKKLILQDDKWKSRIMDWK